MIKPHQQPIEGAMLVAFVDLTGYAGLAARTPAPRDLLGLMNAYFELVGDIIEPAGGIVVKCIGDAALIVFSIDQADAGVQALYRLKEQGDAWLAQQGLASRQHIKVHYGMVASGLVGTRSAKQWDVYGHTVNVAASLPSSGLTLSPEAFRQLGPEARKLFKKHTAQVVYIRNEDRRPA